MMRARAHGLLEHKAAVRTHAGGDAVSTTTLPCAFSGERSSTKPSSSEDSDDVRSRGEAPAAEETLPVRGDSGIEA